MNRSMALVAQMWPGIKVSRPCQGCFRSERSVHERGGAATSIQGSTISRLVAIDRTTSRAHGHDENMRVSNPSTRA